MRVFATIAGWLGAVFVAVPAGANPVSYGRQLCVMLASGISQDKAWSYIAQANTNAAMANPQTVIPWYSAASAGWALGTAIGRQQQASDQVNKMKADVLKVARTTCPEQFSLR